MGRSGDKRRGNSKWKDPEAKKSLMWLRNKKKANMAVKAQVRESGWRGQLGRPSQTAQDSLGHGEKEGLYSTHNEKTRSSSGLL